MKAPIVASLLIKTAAPTAIYTLSLHDALPISPREHTGTTPPVARRSRGLDAREIAQNICHRGPRSEEHTSELQSRQYLVCRLLLEKKKSWAQFNTALDATCGNASLVVMTQKIG